MAPYTVNSVATSEHNGTLKVLRWFKRALDACKGRLFAGLRTLAKLIYFRSGSGSGSDCIRLTSFWPA